MSGLTTSDSDPKNIKKEAFLGNSKFVGKDIDIIFTANTSIKKVISLHIFQM